MAGPCRLGGVLLGFVILALLIAGNVWAFHAVAHTSYLVWYLRNGATIALAASFVGLIWDGVTLRDDLLSAHPLVYLRGCVGLLSVFFYSVSVHLTSPIQGTTGTELGPGSIVGALFDALLSLLALLVTGVVVLAWLLVVAPLNYFITLVSGSLARQELRGQLLRAIVVPRGAGIELATQARGLELPQNAVDVSLARKPFAVTQAITSLVLWLATWTLALSH